MSVDLFIFMLFTGVIICIGLIVFFSVQDGKEKNTFDNAVHESLSESNEIHKDLCNEEIEKSDITQGENKVQPVLSVKAHNPKPVPVTGHKETNTVQRKDNDLPASASDVSINDVTLNLLRAIAKELQKQSENSDSVIVKYLKDDMEELHMNKYGGLLLVNEELIVNGDFLDDAEYWEVNPADNINIRFCVNITVPKGYRVFIEPQEQILEEKGLQVLDIVKPAGDATSIRARLKVNKGCVIRKKETLFLVKVQKEVLL